MSTTSIFGATDNHPRHAWKDGRSTLTTFEHVFTTYPSVIDDILQYLPTRSVTSLYHTNRLLRSFLTKYPIAWKTLSFRLPPPAGQNVLNPAGFDGSDISDLAELPVKFNYLLRSLVSHSPVLARLDLDNTSVDGVELTAKILEPRRGTLSHLSVRGCKRVSLRYHILPWLELETSAPPELVNEVAFALKSLYVYRCRHHRRRPYLPSSLLRRDSDSRPTHQLIELCHRLGIWTDTAWCPTPGPRCYRRKDYYIGHNPADGPTEVWVPFDRLWRSQNFVGPPDIVNSTTYAGEAEEPKPQARGRLWEEEDQGFGGEQIGTGIDGTLGEGKHVPMHMRRTHTAFVEGYHCDLCRESIDERCEQCSVRLHCMGCRKTLCASCAFDRPVKRKRRRLSRSAQSDTITARLSSSFASSSAPASSKRRTMSDNAVRYWWAPRAEKSPNVMTEESDDPSSDEDEPLTPAHALLPHAMRQPRLEMQWCCLRPAFSGGGGIAFHGSPCGDNMRASPLPKGQGWEDPSFANAGRSKQLTPTDSISASNSESDVRQTRNLIEERLGIDPGHFEISQILEQEEEPISEASQRLFTPRSLCQTCHSSTQWRVLCGGCSAPLCIDHDVKSLKIRQCGYRNLFDERRAIQDAKDKAMRGVTMDQDERQAIMNTFYGKWNSIISKMAAEDDMRRESGKWTPSTTSAYQSVDTSEYDLPDATFTQPLSRSDLLEMASHLPHDLTFSQPASELHSSLAMQQSSSAIDNIWSPPHSSTLRRPRSLPHLCRRSRSQSQETTSTVTNAFAPPRWLGCNRFFCPSPRPAGDPRSRCHAEGFVRPCQACRVHICDECLQSAPKQCPCTTCQEHGFLCPNCQRLPEIRSECVWEQEEETRRRKVAEDEELEAHKREEVKERWMAQSQDRADADSHAVEMAEFFRAAEALGLDSPEE